MRETNLILISTAIILIFGVISYNFVTGHAFRTADEVRGSWACTADAKICPDGSSVGRTPPYCQFASCPDQ